MRVACAFARVHASVRGKGVVVQWSHSQCTVHMSASQGPAQGQHKKQKAANKSRCQAATTCWTASCQRASHDPTFAAHSKSNNQSPPMRKAAPAAAAALTLLRCYLMLTLRIMLLDAPPMPAGPASLSALAAGGSPNTRQKRSVSSAPAVTTLAPSGDCAGGLSGGGRQRQGRIVRGSNPRGGHPRRASQAGLM